MNFEMLKSVTTMKDVGVIVDQKLKFNEHIDEVVRKASKMLGFVMRASKQFNQLNVVMNLYKTLVVPHLEYCSEIWSPIYSIHQERIENVQHRFTRNLTIQWKNTM